MSQVDRKELIGQIIDIFEDFLSDRNVRLDNKHCEVGSNDAVIYGKNYDELRDKIQSLLDESIYEVGIV